MDFSVLAEAMNKWEQKTLDKPERDSTDRLYTRQYYKDYK